MATIASPRTPSRYASRDGAGSAGVTARTLVEAPGENPGRRDLHDLGGRLREPGGLAPGHRRLASGFARPVREAPAADAPDVLGLDGLDLGQPRLVPGVELGVEAVADHRLVGPGLAHEPRGHVERVSDEADVAEREWPQGHEVD